MVAVATRGLGHPHHLQVRFYNDDDGDGCEDDDHYDNILMICSNGGL